MLFPSGWGTAAAVAGAVATGLLLAVLATWMTKALANSRTDETVRGELVLGAMGTVVNRIDADQYGEVSVTVAGHLMKYNAKSDEPLPSGARVVVVEVLSPSAVLVTGI
jgi:membrane protein implicated in regulation of membrane protease activity